MTILRTSKKFIFGKEFEERNALNFERLRWKITSPMKLELLSLISNQVTFQSTLVDRLGETRYDLAQFLNSESLEKSGCKIFKLYIHYTTLSLKY